MSSEIETDVSHVSGFETDKLTLQHLWNLLEEACAGGFKVVNLVTKFEASIVGYRNNKTGRIHFKNLSFYCC